MSSLIQSLVPFSVSTSHMVGVIATRSCPMRQNSSSKGDAHPSEFFVRNLQQTGFSVCCRRARWSGVRRQHFCASRFYVLLRKRNHTMDSTPITTRQLEALVRLAQARAKLELREVVTEQASYTAQ